MKTVLQNEKVMMTYSGNQLVLTGNGLKIAVPITAETLIQSFSLKSRVQVSVNLEISKK